MDSKQTAFIFPGQGSQSIGMGHALAETFPSARQVFEMADDYLGFPLSRLAWEGPEESLNDTINTQPALLVHSIAALRVFQEQFPGFRPAIVAGHSMGEISALVAAGALSFFEAIKLARMRGVLMKQAGEVSPGSMAAILGLELDTLENICSQVSTEGEIVQVANDNCPGQVVISGTGAALERAIFLAQQAGARRAKALAVSIAAHSPLMDHAQASFNQAVNAALIQNPELPLIGNVTATPLVTADEIRSELQAQLTSRVRWTESVQLMIRQNICLFIELGGSSVLTGLMKRIDKEVIGISLGSPTDFEKLQSITAV